MSHSPLTKTIAAGAVLLSLTAATAAGAMVQDTVLPQFSLTLPGTPSDDGQLLSRRGRGADDGAGHAALIIPVDHSLEFARRGRGKDDAVNHG
ncbi:MAG: hypothetical protein V4586_09745 [Pseudomonadota bacterium]